MMLRAIVICPDEEICQHLKETTASLQTISIARTLNHYPNELSLTRMVRAVGPQIVLLSVQSLDRALEAAETLEETAPGLYIVAIGRSRVPEMLETLIRSDVREFLPYPFERDTLVQTLARAREALRKKPPAIQSTDLLFAFLPSKAGVGTSTIALNTSVAASRLPDTNTLLCDFDLNSGMIHFMLKLKQSYSVVDASRRAEELDEYIWQDLVSTHQNLDVLSSGDFNPEFRVEVAQIRNLLDFARRHYKAIFVDLSGNMEHYSLDIMRESKRICLVTTPEINALHLARKKYQFLQRQDLGERVSLLLNRMESSSDFPVDQIKELVGLEPIVTFPNDYSKVQSALTVGKPAECRSPFASQCSTLAQRLLEQTYGPVETKGWVSEFLSSRFGWRRPLNPARAAVYKSKNS
jgi:pilus assembly protein CpaE